MIKGQFVLDCSVAMTWCFGEEAISKTMELQENLIHTTCCVPSIWPLEINNVLWVAICKKRISDIQADRFKYLLKALPIRVDLKAADLDNEVIFSLSIQHNLTCYDAAYLELALRENLPLATLDQSLRKAAKSMKIKLLV